MGIPNLQKSQPAGPVVRLGKGISAQRGLSQSFILLPLINSHHYIHPSAFGCVYYRLFLPPADFGRTVRLLLIHDLKPDL
jgi:hypothetical protein